MIDLWAYLDSQDGENEPCPRCDEFGCEAGTDEPCVACQGTGQVC